MGLANKIKQSSGPTTGMATPHAPYGAAAPSQPPQYYGQANDSYGGAKPIRQSPSAPPFPYGSEAPPLSPSPYLTQKSAGYGGAPAPSYPYPSDPQEQFYTQAYAHPGDPNSASQRPWSNPGVDSQQSSTAYPNYPYPSATSYDAGLKDSQSMYASGAAYQQPPSYQQPSSYSTPHADFRSSNSSNMLAQKVQSIVQCHGLQRFYDTSRLQSVLQRVSTVDFGKLAAQWKIGIELAYDLAPLALYDIVFYCDDSGSMAFEENGERIDDLKFILSKVSAIATLFDDDGITIRFMNSNVIGDGVRSAADVERLLSQVTFSGATPLGTNLERKVIQPLILGKGMAKPVLVIVITDGEPYGESRDKIAQVIRQAKDTLARSAYGNGALAVQIAQVGKDAKTQKFLESLDKDPVVGGMIDCTSYYEMEEEEFARKGVTLTPELWLLKMCVGAIDPEYDSKDD